MDSSGHSALPGHLYIVPTPIGNLGDLSERARATLASVDKIACEDTRVTGKLLHLLELPKVPLVSYREANENVQAEALTAELLTGTSIALVCDAGTPLVSDPGFRLTRACQKAKVPVVPLPGPSAFLTALSASGLPSNHFEFIGFLPPKSAGRKRLFESYKQTDRTIICYESCHRVEKSLNELLEVLGPEHTICLARELTKQHETLLVGSVKEVQEAQSKRSSKGEFVLILAPTGFTL